MEQGSQEWIEARLGKVTASRITDVLAKNRSGPAATRQNYLAELVSERLTGVQGDFYQSYDMRRGIELEPEARLAYEFLTDNDVELVGFVDHPRIPMAGASPDGLINADGCVEFKCPKIATHIKSLLNEAVPRVYALQMQFQMDCCERLWCDYVSYCPHLPPPMNLFIRQIERDSEQIVEIQMEVGKLLAEVAETGLALRERFGVAA